MEEESFEDIEIAAYINQNYIPIKIDREERPDLDAIFMQAGFQKLVALKVLHPMRIDINAHRMKYFESY